MTRILSAVLLTLIIISLVCAFVVNSHLRDVAKAEALSTTELYTLYVKNAAEAAIYPSGGLFDAPGDDLDLKLLIISNDETVVYSDEPAFMGEGLVSLVFGKNSVYITDKISAFLKNPSAENNMLIKSYSSIFSGRKSYMGIAPVTGGYFVFVDIPEASLTDPHGSVVWLILFFGALGAVLVCFTVFLVNRGVSRDIKHLTSVARKKAAGEFNLPFTFTEKPHKDEVTYLGESLDNMILAFSNAREKELKSIDVTSKQEKQRASDDARALFLSKISHEIRTPMNSILGVAQLLLEEESLTEAQKKHISDIKISSDMLLHIINDLIDISKLTSGKMSVYTHDYDFQQLIDNVSSLAQFLTERKGLEYKFNVKGELPRFLYGDDVRLKQILINIINNAVNFTEKGFVSFEAGVNGGNLVFEIRDTGRGIKTADIEYIFDPFKTPEQTGKGTGMGLPIAKKLAELMDGGISVASQHGVGSVFVITIPITHGEETKKKISKPVETDLYYSENTRVLIVDDNEINLQVAEGLISSLYGIECDMALSGKEALAFVEKNRYDLIFMDHMMPEMDGVQTTHRIRDMGGVRLTVPIIALTANAVVETKDLLIKEGMNDFLAKPINVEEMGAVLQKWLPREKRTKKLIDVSLKPEPKASSTDNPVVSAASEIQELDVSEGLANCAFKMDVYENSLKLLSDRIPEVIQRSEKHLDENNLPELSQCAHFIKGSLSVVGATSLAQLAQKLETASKNGDDTYCREALPVFNKRLGTLGKLLVPVFGLNQPDAKQKVGTREILAEYCKVITEALNDYNHELLTSTASEMSVFDFGERINSDVTKIMNCAGVFDYEGVTGIIHRLKENK
jgi:signal transduction histidine kinase/CheY-like chemotaxis protein/HPt (histidine-containing phosphotransfer) domain-containing protein